MQTPDLKLVETGLKIQGIEDCTVLCVACKTPLWKIEGFKRGYHTCKKISLDERVERWSEYWSKDGLKPLKYKCPCCFEPYFVVIMGPNNTTFPKLHILEIDGA